MVNKRNFRPERVAERIRQELATIIQFELTDPRLDMLSITEVTVTRDLSHAKVYFSLLDQHDANDAMQALEQAAKQIRHSLAKQLKNMRVTPTLRFYYDSSIEQGNRLSALIDTVISNDNAEKNNNQQE